jgi:hypothetical protein
MADDVKMHRTIERLYTRKGWHAVYHQTEAREQAMFERVLFFAQVLEWPEGEPLKVVSRVLPMVYDVESLDNGLCFADEKADFIALCEPGGMRTGDWNYVAAERVRAEEEEEERQERKRKRLADDEEMGSNNPRSGPEE